MTHWPLRFDENKELRKSTIGQTEFDRRFN
ncbi:hypothetical protein COLO4_06136 [Corchorus olitorius]|uniref:Uncharacterized protein n=1 Tax=Corchorus olitorius TaxID=93759 RepID=A0A1R3KNT9_9ROSI|nr:hypothetical protein COLO4_06136 [Corchorus olitorius]